MADLDSLPALPAHRRSVRLSQPRVRGVGGRRRDRDRSSTRPGAGAAGGHRERRQGPDAAGRRQRDAARHHEEQAARHPRGVREVRRVPVLRSVIWIGIIIGISAGGFDALYPRHIVENYQIPLVKPVIWFGILAGGVMLLTIPSLEIAKRYLAKNPTVPVSSLLSIFEAFRNEIHDEIGDNKSLKIFLNMVPILNPF